MEFLGARTIYLPMYVSWGLMLSSFQKFSTITHYPLTANYSNFLGVNLGLCFILVLVQNI